VGYWQGGAVPTIHTFSYLHPQIEIRPRLRVNEAEDRVESKKRSQRGVDGEKAIENGAQNEAGAGQLRPQGPQRREKRE
jgi:hypothetical protein